MAVLIFMERYLFICNIGEERIAIAKEFDEPQQDHDDLFLGVNRTKWSAIVDQPV